MFWIQIQTEGVSQIGDVVQEEGEEEEEEREGNLDPTEVLDCLFRQLN